MDFRRDESGQTLVLTALCLTCFMGFLALAVDVGVLFNTRRQLQIAADAAATAAALQYLDYYNASGDADQTDAEASAIAAGNAAGLANSSNASVSVTVNTNSNSPAAHTGCTGTTCFFQAVVSEQSPTIFFSTFFGSWQGQSANPFTVAARAVAGTPNVSNNCLFLTNPTGTALTTRGNWSINASCGVYINSNSSSVEDDTGNAANSGVSATSISIVGALPNDVTVAPGSTPTVLRTLPQTVPFSNVASPTVPASCPAGGTLTGTPAAGCYSGNVTIGTATLSGLYIFTGDVTIDGAVNGTGVTLAIMGATSGTTTTWGSLSIAPGNSTISLFAPTSGTYNGILVYQPLANANPLDLQAGHSTGTLGGFIYAPGAQLAMQDHGGNLAVEGLIVDDINNGPAVLDVTGYGQTNSPLKQISLVE